MDVPRPSYPYYKNESLITFMHDSAKIAWAHRVRHVNFTRNFTS
jgi:hypothetical protein